MVQVTFVLSLALVFKLLLLQAGLRLSRFVLLVNSVLRLVLPRLLARGLLRGVLRSSSLRVRRLRRTVRRLRLGRWLLLLRLAVLLLVLVFFVLRVRLRQNNRRFRGARHPCHHNERRYGGQEKRHGLDR